MIVRPVRQRNIKWKEMDIHMNGFFKACEAGSVSDEDFVEYAVEAFHHLLYITYGRASLDYLLAHLEKSSHEITKSENNS